MAFLFGAKQDTMVPYVGCVVSDSDSIVPAPSNAYSQAWDTNLGSSRLLLTKRATKEFRGSNPACKSYDSTMS